MPVRLKRLALHGFKSFAKPVELCFDQGITVIVGPNGSGKSNIADAIRWVLGEQSYSTLRGRQAADVIFAGGPGVAPMGMAEVSVTLEQDDGELGVPFTEVTVTRRAFRDGENQYAINGRRVRLRDVLHLTAALGSSHTVIGQGLVDAVLSQRPADRRGLFEHAAGISALRLRHAEASTHLAQAEEHAARLRDLLQELQPRVVALERAARQAEAALQAREALQAALERLYCRRLRDMKDRLSAARAAECAASAAAAHVAARLQKAVLALAEADAERACLQREIDDLHRDRDAHHRVLQEKTHQVALLAARAAACRERLADLAQRAEELERDGSRLEQERQALEAENATLLAARHRIERELAGAESVSRAVEAEWQRLREALQAIDQEEQHLRRQVERLESERARAEERLAGLRAELASLTASTAEREQQRATIAAAREERVRAAAELEVRIGEGARMVAERERAEAEAIAERDKTLAALREIEREHATTTARLETFERAADSSGNRAVHAVVEAARAGQLTGIVGPLGRLIEVPPELETAVEVALGSHVHDIVVERWADAEAAIAYLKETRSGRATFQPLDTVRPGARSRPDVARASPGVIGIASELVQCDARYRIVVESLLGRIVIVRDLPTARTLLDNLPAGWTIVTRDGDLARSSGAVTGGAHRGRERGLLAQLRHARGLAKRRARLDEEMTRMRQRLESLEADLADRRAQRQHAEEVVSALRAEQHAVRLEIELLELRERETVAAQQRAQAREAAVAAQLQDAETAFEHTRGELELAHAQLRRLIADRRQQEEALAALSEQRGRDRLATLRAEHRGIEQQLRVLRQQADRLHRRSSELERARAQLAHDRAQLEAELARLDAERETLLAAVAEHESTIATIEQACIAKTAALRDAAAREQAARECVAELERQRHDAERELERCRSEHHRASDEEAMLVERIRWDLGDDGLARLTQRLAADAAADTTPLETLEETVATLREQCRRLGRYGEESVHQYRAEKARYEQLQHELDDVLATSQRLRETLGYLERHARQAFDTTVDEVDRAFRRTFTELFGGGRAQLLRANGTGTEAGIEIVAQPPGKRLQSLHALSGGERALTAVALLFAILRVRPSPLCVLDEVDAALDDANVTRFRDLLRSLSDRTQFVVITHNRATIESASVLYGVTMGEDGISRVLSLRLPDTP